MAEENNNVLLEMAANGNAEALAFMRELQALAHRIDDLVDETQSSPWKMLEAFQTVMTLFSVNPFYVRNRDVLFPTIVLAYAHYVQSVCWEKSAESHKRSIADYLRGDLNSVFELVSLLTGGPKLMREFIPAIREDSWKAHHATDGKPV